MNRTPIEWVKNPDGTQGYTWNPITGCLNGCPYCYARKLANTRLKSRYLANLNIALPHEKPHDAFSDPFYPRLWLDRMDAPFAKKPRGIFVCDMADLFGIGIPEAWTQLVMDRIKANPQHRYYLLTKQPQNLAQWSPFPPNCRVGVSVTSSDMMAGAFGGLDFVSATIKYISFEPLLSAAGVEAVLGAYHYRWLDWLIIGGQTKPTVMPKKEWVDALINAAGIADIPVFLKDSLKPLYPEGLRQEMPIIKRRRRNEMPGL